MKVKITESRLRKLVEACVKEALEDAMEEGHAWDVYRGASKDIDGTEPLSWDEVKAIAKGHPDKEKYRKAKDRYNASKKDMLYNPESYGDVTKYNPNGMENIHQDAALDAFDTEPGISGTAKRFATGAALAAKSAIKRGGKALKNKLSSKKNKDDEYGSFTL